MYQKYCFLQRNDHTSTPGTALFQHWLSDYDSHNNNTKFDPWNDFPTWDVLQQYPDISVDRDYYTLWYTTTINMPENEYNDSRGHLTLHVNYQPFVYFNGKLLHPYTTTSNAGDDYNDVGGMFLRRHYALGISSSTSLSTATLEVLVLPPPHVGKPIKHDSAEINPKYGLEMGQGGDHEIAKSGAIMQFTAGWDWIQSTPDRNVGIHDRVELEWISGDIRLHDLHVKVVSIVSSEENDEEYTNEPILPLGDDITVSARLEVSLTVTMHCQNEKQPVKGKLEYWITPSTSSLTILTSGAIHNITIQQSVVNYDLGKVLLHNVQLWWPHSHSSRHNQPLYTLHVRFTSYDNTNDEGSSMSLHKSQTQATFGIRTISSFIHPNTKSFALKVNGHPIFLAGGNWIATDQFLRYSNSPKRYYQELSLIRHVGMNAIRVWGGGIAETDHFYNAADVLGLLVYQEFWMTGDCNGKMAGSYDWPDDHNAYLANVEDTIKRLRNHPSLCLYAAGNELFPIPSSTSSLATNPPRDIAQRLEEYIVNFDGTRPYVTSSVTADTFGNTTNTFDNTKALGSRDGPYKIQREEIFFSRNGAFGSPLLTDDEIKRNIQPLDVKDKDSSYRNIGFQTEVGSVSHPESMKRFLSQEALDSYPNCGETSEYGSSVHEEWTYFKYIPFTEEDTGLDHICQFAFPPYKHNSTNIHRMDTIDDYTWAAQFAQYLQYKSLFEGYTYRIWEWYSAVFLWKVSSPSPTFRGALYDTYLATNGGYWGARAALAVEGDHIRLVLNLHDWTIHVINSAPIVVTAVTSVQWSAYSLRGTLLKEGSETRIPGDGTIHGDNVIHLEESLPWVGMDLDEMSDVLIYRLELSYADNLGTTNTARNSYYLTDPSLTSYKSRFALLGALRKEVPLVNLDVRCIMDSGIKCTIHNNLGTDVVAVMIRLALVRGMSDDDTDRVKRNEDSRILPTLFSDNYLTLIPGETSIVQVSLENIDPSMIGVYLKCTTDSGKVKILNNDVLMLLVDGWNVQEQKVHISCGTNNVSIS